MIEPTEKVDNLEGVFSYILAGWKCLQKFLGPASVSVMREMGQVLFSLLSKTENTNFKKCHEQSKDIVDYALCVCRLCLIPVSSINIITQENEMTIELIEDQSININKALKDDLAWSFLPFPAISLLYYLLNKYCNIPVAPTRFNAKYIDNKWVYTFKFVNKINLNCLNFK